MSNVKVVIECVDMVDGVISSMRVIIGVSDRHSGISKKELISKIRKLEGNGHIVTIQTLSGNVVKIVGIDKYLTTNPNDTTSDNLSELGSCKKLSK